MPSMWGGQPGDFSVIDGVLNIYYPHEGRYLPTEVFKLPWGLDWPDGHIPSQIGESIVEDGRIKHILLDPVFLWKTIR